MFDQLVDGVRKASESSLHMQQEMFRHWTRVWLSAAPGSMGMSTVNDWSRGSQKRWLQIGVEMLNKHREALDSVYKAGIQIIEQSFHVADAQSADDYRRLVEELWRKLFDLQKEQAESQFRDFQAWFSKTAGFVQEAAQA